MTIHEDDMPHWRLECLRVAVDLVSCERITPSRGTVEDLADALLDYVLNGQKEKAGG